MLRQADDQPANNIDDKNENGGNRIAFDEFRGTIHCTVEIRFLGDFLAAGLGFFICQDTGIQISIDGHLLAWHRIKGKAGGHFRYAASTLGDNNKIDNNQNDKDKNTDSIIAGNHKLAESLDDLASRICTVMAFAQNNTCRGDIQAKAQNRCNQQQAGKA